MLSRASFPSFSSADQPVPQCGQVLSKLILFSHRRTIRILSLASGAVVGGSVQVAANMRQVVTASDTIVVFIVNAKVREGKAQPLLAAVDSLGVGDGRNRLPLPALLRACLVAPSSHELMAEGSLGDRLILS